jgi:hypothetical protein
MEERPMNVFKTAALALAASGTILAAVPAAAYELPAATHNAAWSADADEWNQWRGRGHDRHDRYDRSDRSRYGRDYDRDYRGRDRDRNYNCRKSNGTTGLIIGGAAGALLGREIDGGRERTLGTILGAAGGALLGKEVDSGTVCR